MMRNGKLLWRFVVPALLLAAWQAASSAGMLRPLFFPPPVAIWRAIVHMARTGELAKNLWITLTRAALGFGIGAVAGVLLGVWMGRAPRIRTALEPMFAAINATPRLALFPVLLVVMGVNDGARVLLVAIGSMVILAMHSLDAVRRVSPAYVELAVNYGSNGWGLFRDVYFPACLPRLFTGFRTALARAVVVEISAELLSSTNGMGSTIWLAWQTFSIDRLYASVLIVAAVGSVIHESLLFLERRAVPWKS